MKKTFKKNFDQHYHSYMAPVAILLIAVFLTLIGSQYNELRLLSSILQG